jgi:hypothetical protein
MEIIVKSISGSEIKVSVESNDSPPDLKAKIEKATGIPVDKQYLIYQGKCVYEPDYTLADYGIKDGSTVHFASRRRS